jgi:RNA polymerase sigma-70 factor (ECF subfamily)
MSMPAAQAIDLPIVQSPTEVAEQYSRIYRYTLSLLHNAADAEDVTQETFLRAHQHRGTLHNAQAELAWLYQIATHVCLDRIRQRHRRMPLEDGADVTEIEVADPAVPPVQRVVEQHEMSGCVQEYVARISDSHRAVILLHDVQKLTAPEIAAVLGISVANVKIRLHRARRELKASLEAGCAFASDERGVLTCESKL